MYGPSESFMRIHNLGVNFDQKYHNGECTRGQRIFQPGTFIAACGSDEPVDFGIEGNNERGQTLFNR